MGVVYRVSLEEVYTFDFVLLVHLCSDYFETLAYTINNQGYIQTCCELSIADTKWWHNEVPDLFTVSQF